ncbi:hypothetical protein WR25_23289 [Diploscapter pachys]|uniref:Neurotransmitter-gated ion-channel ligand-binding domain-containing protein n=1 Tax=Diploscapter pachys TaxID=2018661 RepID=A0A2A2J7K4_9BILA|nr:hypothetical protein WR25_23289 [Diploscapter pachys]
MAILKFVAHYFLLPYLLSVECNKFESQLYEELLFAYNKNVRPVKHANESVKVKFGASLIRIIELDEVNQILTTNLWLEIQWVDYKLRWKPEDKNGIKKLHMPSDEIWLPDIVLSDNAVGEAQISIRNDAIVYYNGLVVWKPPAIFKSFCSIDIEHFPYDSQTCHMTFMGWSYDGYDQSLRQIPMTGFPIVFQINKEKNLEMEFSPKGMDLSYFQESMEWDLISLTSVRHLKFYVGCCGHAPYPDITYKFVLRRKPLFYTVNLVIPAMLIAFLAMSTLYVPPIEHKIAHSTNVFVAISIFYLVLIDLLPANSVVISLIGKYLLFLMLEIFIVTIQSVAAVNFYRRTTPLPELVRRLFIKTLPKFVFLKPFGKFDESMNEENDSTASNYSGLFEVPSSRRPSPYYITTKRDVMVEQLERSSTIRLSHLAQLRGMHSDVIRRMIDSIGYVADYCKALKREAAIRDECEYIATVFDRIILVVFLLVNTIGTAIVLQSSWPAFFGSVKPLTADPVTRPLTGDKFESFIDNFSATEWWTNDGSHDIYNF